MSPGRRRATMIAMVAERVVGVPAAALLAAPRTTTPDAQVSINTSAPAFAVAGLLPGDSMTRCIRVRNEGDAAIGLIDGAAVTGDLAPYLRMTVERGSGLGDLGPSCAGFTPAGGYAFGTTAAGVPPSGLSFETDPAWSGHAEKSLRITVRLPADAPNAAMAKSGTLQFAFAGVPLAPAGTGDPGGGGTPSLPGGLAPGTTGGIDKSGHFVSNKEIKRRLRIGKARLLKNGNVVVTMWLPAGGAIRAKVILPGNHIYAHTLLPVEWGPKVHILLKRRSFGAATVRRYRHA
ncbi:MAG: hypothetical protein QOG68_2508, partial [Solirubrobacteraceae bacterium]|nr:hypothetical protein [Solirubrobacteraceae bacterium]